MAKTKTPIEERIPADVLEAIDEAAVEIAAETNLTRSEARERILNRISAKADAAEVDEVADEVEEEEEDKDGKKKSKKSDKDSPDDEETEDGEDEEDEDEEDEKPKVKKKDEKPPQTHWSSRPLFGGKR